MVSPSGSVFGQVQSSFGLVGEVSQIKGELDVKSKIKGELDVNPTGQALADLIHKEQQILAKEVRWLQDKAWKARRRAGERKEHRNKTQNTLLKRISY